MTGAWRWFSRMFGMAVIAHIAGNPPVGQVSADEVTALGGVTLVLGLVAVSLVVRPDRRMTMVAAALVLASIWFEAPFLGNHWLLMGMVALAVLATSASPDGWVRLAPTARWILLGFYSFAAFAKLNSGFFDPTASCSVFYANQSLESVGLAIVPPGEAVAMLIVVGTALIELSVPVLLLIPRTRRLGVLVGVVFHTLVSLDLAQHFYDFSAVLLLLFGTFLPDEDTAELDEVAGQQPMLFKLAVAGAVLVVLAAVVPLTQPSRVILGPGAFVVWIPLAAWIVGRIGLGGAGLGGASRAEVPLRLRGVLPIIIVCIVFANGLTPYLEVKTAYGFNMYSNLVTVAGESNHFIIRDTLPLTDVQSDLVQVVASDDPGLAAYVGTDYLVPRRNIQDYLARNSGTSVDISQGSIESSLDGSDAKRLPLLVEKFQLFRAVDTQSPPRCQADWLPAR